MGYVEQAGATALASARRRGDICADGETARRRSSNQVNPEGRWKCLKLRVTRALFKLM
jgi:hypothetical protein